MNSRAKDAVVGAVVCAVAHLLSSQAMAKEMSFGGIEVGVTSCQEAIKVSSEFTSKTFQSAITGNAGIKLQSHAFGFDFVNDATVLCGEDEKVAAIHIEMPKDRANEIADVLASKYRQKSRNLPFLGAGSAIFQSSTGGSLAKITYIHVSFSAELIMQTPEFARLHVEYNKQEAKKEKERTRSAF